MIASTLRSLGAIVTLALLTPAATWAAGSNVDGKMYTAADCIAPTIRSGLYLANVGGVINFQEDYVPNYGDLQHNFFGHAYNAIDPFADDAPDALTVICPVIREHSRSGVHMVVVTLDWKEPVKDDFCTFMTFMEDGRLRDFSSNWEKISSDFDPLQRFRLKFNALPATATLGGMLLMCNIPTAELEFVDDLDNLPEFASFIRGYRIEERF